MLDRRRLAMMLVLLISSLLFASRPAPAADATRNACLGGSFAEFGAGDPLVMTYLYYWYDPRSLDDPALTLRPPADQPFDWNDPAWHRRQLLDMAEAGVDVALAVYWGAGLDWSIQGLDALVAAREALLAEGARPPAIGLFFDSNLYADILAGHRPLSNLRAEIGREIFVGHLLHFFEHVPPCHQARVDGRPIIFLWRPDTEVGDRLSYDQTTIEAIYDTVERRLGARPHLVRERTWDAYARDEGVTLRTEDVFGWGAALKGPLFDGRIVAVGPGYDDRSVPDRQGYVRDREQGRAYERDLRSAVASGASWLLLETWNELWEATAIGETAQYGREYLETTRRYTSMFRELHARSARDGWVDLGTGEDWYVTVVAEAPEERGMLDVVDGRFGTRPFVEPGDETGYVHFALRPRLRAPNSGSVSVSVEYFDGGKGSFALEYDGDDRLGPDDGVFTPTRQIMIEGTNRWLTHVFEITGARFSKRQYGGYADFRIRDSPTAGDPTHVFGRIVIVTNPESTPRPVLLGPETLSPLRPSLGHFFELRWRGIAEAHGYLVQLVPPEAAEPTLHGFRPADRQRCLGGPAWAGTVATQAVTAEERCLLEHVPSADAGVYRWRVWGLDAAGQPAWEPSDWGLLLADR